MQSLFADQNWTKVASAKQFDKVVDLMSEYYGMKHTSDLKEPKESFIDSSSVMNINISKNLRS